MIPEEVVEEMKNWDVGDDAGLAVFADWLEEHNEPDWAWLARTFHYKMNSYGEDFSEPFPQWLMRHAFIHKDFAAVCLQVWKSYEEQWLRNKETTWLEH